MKYSVTERLAIGQQIYEKKMNKETAAIKYDINVYTARDYLRQYKAFISSEKLDRADIKNAFAGESASDLQKMSKRELIELVLRLVKD